MKKILFQIACLLFPLCTFAYELESNGIYYNLDHTTKSADVTSTSPELSGVVAIPDYVTMDDGSRYDVTRILDFRSRYGLTSVTIPNSVTFIGWRAFYHCSGLTSVTIPNSVTWLEGEAFEGCSGLTSVTISNSLSTIKSSVFKDCSSLTSVNIPRSVTLIESSAFEGCSSLTSITIPSPVISIGDRALCGCTDLLDLYCLNRIPPRCGSNTFDGLNTLNCRLHVPDGAREDYALADGWCAFSNIIEASDEKAEVPLDLPVTFDFEYEDDFNKWEIINHNMDFYTWERKRFSNWSSDRRNSLLEQGYCAQYDGYYCTNTPQDFLKSPVFNTEVGKKYKVTCRVMCDRYVEADKVTPVNENYAMYSGNADATPDEGFNLFAEGELIGGSQGKYWKEREGVFTATDNQQVVAFAVTSKPKSGTLYLGNLAIREYSATDLSVESVSGSSIAIFGQETPITVEVKNRGYEPVSHFTVRVFDEEGNSVVEQEFDQTIASEETVTVTVPWTIRSQRVAKIRAEVILDGDTYPADNRSRYYTMMHAVGTAANTVPTGGDANGDGVVNVQDYVGIGKYILQGAFEGFDAEAADANNDGNVNVQDYLAVAQNILAPTTDNQWTADALGQVGHNNRNTPNWCGIRDPYTLSQVVYYGSELGLEAGDIITGIGFLYYVAESFEGFDEVQFRVNLGNTDLEQVYDVRRYAQEYSYIPNMLGSQYFPIPCFDGFVPYNETEGEGLLFFNFDTPFVYEGNNVLMQIERVESSKLRTGDWDGFKCEMLDDGSGETEPRGRALFYRADSTPTGTIKGLGLGENNLPVLVFSYIDASGNNSTKRVLVGQDK